MRATGPAEGVIRVRASSLNRADRYVMEGGGPAGRWFGPTGSLVAAQLGRPFVSQRVVVASSAPTRDELEALTALLVSGRVTPAIDRTFPLAEVPQAMRYLVEGRPPAKGVIRV